MGCNEFLHRVIMRDCSIKANKTINRETVIFDCTNMNWGRKYMNKEGWWRWWWCISWWILLSTTEFHMPALYFIKAISDTDQKYYPETLNKLYLVNAPSAFVMVWKIVKAWLDPGVSSENVCVTMGTDQLTMLDMYVDHWKDPNSWQGFQGCPLAANPGWKFTELFGRRLYLFAYAWWMCSFSEYVLPLCGFSKTLGSLLL